MERTESAVDNPDPPSECAPDPLSAKSARGPPGGVSGTLSSTTSPSETGSTDPPQPLPHPLPRTRLTPLNPPPYTPKPHPPSLARTRVRALGADLWLDPRVAEQFKQQAKVWAERHLFTSGISHRPPVLSAYLAWLVRERSTRVRAPRAVSGREAETRVRLARAVAPWSPVPHRYDGPPKVRRSELCLHRSLLTVFPKEGDSTVRRRALQALNAGILAAVEGRDLLDPLTVSATEVHRLQWLKPADAERFVARAV